MTAPLAGGRPIDPSPSLQELVARHDAARGDAVLRDGPRARVTRVSCDATGAALVKEERGGGPWRACARLLGGGRAARAYRAARALAAAGIAAPEALGHVRGPWRSLVVLRFIPGVDLQRALAHDRARPAALARAAARFAARLHERGFAPRDLKPPNLIVLAACGARTEVGDALDEPALALVDLDDVRRGRPARREVVRNLAALDAYGQRLPEPLGVRARARALAAYAEARGFDRGERRALLRDVLLASRAKRRASGAVEAPPRP